MNFFFVQWYPVSKADYHAIFSMICTLLGIGSLAMPYSYSEAGLLLGTIALGMMCIINIYATVVLSSCFTNVPKHVNTFTDLGEHVGGTVGKVAVQLTHLSTCLLIPIAFLILGGKTLLPAILQGAFDSLIPTYWIMLMAATLLPACCIQNLKEAAWVMIFGAMTALFSVTLALISSMIYEPWNRYEATEVKYTNVFPVFGTMALSYGAALIVPTLQREHPSPQTMPGAIVIALAFVTLIYLIIAVLGYAQYGCSSPQNLLTAMGDGIMKRTAYLLMQLHVMVAFAVIINPALFYFERLVFGMHKNVDVNDKEAIHKDVSRSSPAVTMPAPIVTPRGSIGSHLGEIMYIEEDIVEPFSTSDRVKSILFRISVVVIQTILAVLGQKSFTDIADFIGATTITGSCIVLPCLFYYIKFSFRLKVWEKAICLTVILVSILLSIYTAYFKLEKIIAAAAETATITFPFCPVGYLSRHYKA